MLNVKAHRGINDGVFCTIFTGLPATVPESMEAGDLDSATGGPLVDGPP
jgi:hypothetical protein